MCKDPALIYAQTASTTTWEPSVNSARSVDSLDKQYQRNLLTERGLELLAKKASAQHEEP